MIYHVIGIMSGTSMDGLDIAFCKFSKKNERWSYSIEKAVTCKYDNELLDRLNCATELDGFELIKLDVELANFIGDKSLQFIQDNQLKVDFISSHGHTVFHEPGRGITLQIGRGSVIAARTGHPVVCDFRSGNVAHGGQGAPLVPVGDELLFNNYEACLNLGGFSNISFAKENKRIAYDICPVNILLNYLCQKVGKEYDDHGEMGRTGKLIIPLFEKLNDIEYYNKVYPKSLGKEWLETEVLPLLARSGESIPDLLRTCAEHAVFQISRAINNVNANTVLMTGGGVYNSFLIELIEKRSNASIVIPNNELVDFKEALIFAFLGVLRMENSINCLASVTGASKNHIGGCVYLP